MIKLFDDGEYKIYKLNNGKIWFMRSDFADTGFLSKKDYANWVNQCPEFLTGKK